MNSTKPRFERAEKAATPIARLQQQLKHVGDTRHSTEGMIAGCLKVLRDTIRPAAIVYCVREDNSTAVVPARDLSPPGSANVQGRFQACLDECCADCGEVGDLRVRQLQGNLTVICVPVLLLGRTEVIGVIATPACGVETTTSVMQTVASQIALFESRRQLEEAEAESSNSAALLELLAKSAAASDPKHASVVLANEIKEFLGCKAVAIGLTSIRSRDCHLTAFSGSSRFARRSEFTAALEAAMAEAIIRDRITVWPTDSQIERVATLAHRRAATVSDATMIVSSPLKDERQNILGAWLFLDGCDAESTRAGDITRFVAGTRGQISAQLMLLSKASESPIKRQIRILSRLVEHARTKAALLLGICFLAVMLCPMRYKIDCQCQVQPVIRRFVAAPYDGRLERNFVEPGDEVQAGDLLARLDGRELRWELAGLQADYESAEKGRDAAMAADRIGEAQLAALEKERLQLKIQLIRRRLQNLEIRSPIKGIVVSGDLRKVEGAPLTLGQTLFEIAPLERMVLEVEIPEREVLHSEAGQQVVFRVDANPKEKWSGQIRTVFPQSEIRDNESVYIAEVDVENHGVPLRPGMKGRAKVIADRHLLGWNLFHRPFESLCMFLGW